MRKTALDRQAFHFDWNRTLLWHQLLFPRCICPSNWLQNIETILHHQALCPLRLSASSQKTVLFHILNKLLAYFLLVKIQVVSSLHWSFVCFSCRFCSTGIYYKIVTICFDSIVIRLWSVLWSVDLKHLIPRTGEVITGLACIYVNFECRTSFCFGALFDWDFFWLDSIVKLFILLYTGSD